MDERLRVYLLSFNGRSSPSTASRASYQLRAFCGFLKSLGTFSLSEIGREQLAHWVKSLCARGLRPLTLRSYQGVVYGFIAWLHREGYLLVNPWPEEWKPRRLAHLPRHVPSEKGAVKILERVAEESRCPLRDRALLELCYSSGLRRGELWRLSVSDIRGDFLRVLGKGNKERLVPLGGKAKAALWQYIRTERQRKVDRFNPAEEALFVSWNGGRLGLASYSYVVSRHRGGSKITLHSFRHACATHMLKNGASIRVIQKLLGHRRLSTTQIYTQVDTMDLRRVLENHHPRG